jgi:hypothetical protein
MTASYLISPPLFNNLAIKSCRTSDPLYYFEWPCIGKVDAVIVIGQRYLQLGL